MLTADIEKMYLQVLLHPDDWKYQQIFWYYNNEIRAFVIKVAAFGEGPFSYPSSLYVKLSLSVMGLAYQEWTRRFSVLVFRLSGYVVQCGRP